jgi:hypothetical protein
MRANCKTAVLTSKTLHSNARLGRGGRGLSEPFFEFCNYLMQYDFPDTRHPTPDTRHPTPDTRHLTPEHCYCSFSGYAPELISFLMFSTTTGLSSR